MTGRRRRFRPRSVFGVAPPADYVARMPHSLHEKIERALAQRGLLKRDLARALNVSPQTATDICKGRSAVTLPHLRRLVAFFGLRADYWLDDERLDPAASDDATATLHDQLAPAMSASGATVTEPAALCRRLLAFARERKIEFAARFADLSDDERVALTLPRRDSGHAGQVSAPIEVIS